SVARDGDEERQALLDLRAATLDVLAERRAESGLRWLGAPREGAWAGQLHLAAEPRGPVLGTENHDDGDRRVEPRRLAGFARRERLLAFDVWLRNEPAAAVGTAHERGVLLCLFASPGPLAQVVATTRNSGDMRCGIPTPISAAAPSVPGEPPQLRLRLRRAAIGVGHNANLEIGPFIGRRRQRLGLLARVEGELSVVGRPPPAVGLLVLPLRPHPPTLLAH